MREIEKTGALEEAAGVAYDPLWESFRLGNTGAFEEIFRRYYPVLFNYSMRFAVSEAEAKDSIQALFLQIWERREFLGQTTSLRNYLLASLRRSLLKEAAAARHGNTGELPEFRVELSTESNLIRSQTEAENAHLLRQAFELLPQRQKEAIFLRFYEERDFYEIARIMNISTRAVYKLIYKGLDNLQNHLVQSNIDLSYLLVLFLVTLV